MSGAITDVSDSTFETEVLKSSLPVLVDFWAEWCGPCRQIAPAMEELANDFKGQLKVVKINIDDNPGTPGTYGVRGIPTLMLFRDGHIDATKIGAMPKSKLYEWVRESL